MNQHTSIGTFALLLLASVASGQTPERVDLAEYLVTDLGSLNGPGTTAAPGTAAMGLSESGGVVGHSVHGLMGGGLSGFSWEDRVLTELPPIAGDTLSQAFAIDDRGGIVGVSYRLGTGVRHAVSWTAGVPTVLGDFQANAVASDGTVVGELPVDAAGVHAHACSWKDGRITDLGTLGGSYSAALAIDGRRIVGYSLTAGDEATRAFLYSQGASSDLGTLGGPNSRARDLNGHGQVVGTSDTAGGLPHACLFELAANGAVTGRVDLGELGGGYSHAMAINEEGEVVGTSDGRAFRWRSGEGMVDLNHRILASSRWQLVSATGVNRRGQIAGYGWHAGRQRAFLLTPAAETRDQSSLRGAVH